MQKRCLDCNNLKSNKGNYCKKCGYKHRKRPINLIYNIKVKNKGWIKKGSNPWNKGKKGLHLSPKTEFKKGQVNVNKGKPQYWRRGENHHNWKGGRTQLVEQIRKHFKNRQWRSDIFQRDNFTCQRCFIKGGRLNAHHIKEFYKILDEYKINTLEEALNCEELFNINNGLTLCQKCHDKTKKRVKR